MTASDLLQVVIPLGILLISIFICWSFKVLNFDILRIFKKSFIQFTVVSSSIIVIFAVVYFIILSVDLAYAAQNENMQIYEMISSSTQEELDGIIRFSGLKIKDYSSMYHFFIDMLYFSAMTFFTVGYGDITVKGALRIIPIFEAFLGVFFSTLVVAMLIINYQSQEAIDKERKKSLKNQELLKICLCRGYSITNVHKEVIPESNYMYYSVFLNQGTKKEVKLDYILNLENTADDNIREDLEGMIALFKSYIV